VLGSDTTLGGCSAPPPGSYTTSACVPGSSNTLGSNSAIATCPDPGAGAYTTSACVSGSATSTGTATAIAPCALPTPGSFTTAPCVGGSATAAGSNTVISACAVPSAGSRTTTACISGSAAAVGADTVIATCAVPTAGNYTASTCVAGSATAVGTNTSISPCLAPPAGSYTSATCVTGSATAAGSNTATLVCSVPAAGQYASSPCIAGSLSALGSNTGVASCAAGTDYTSSSGQTSCTACSTCSGATFTQSACTVSANTVCTACATGCTSCTSANVCTACSAGFTLSGGRCNSLGTACGSATEGNNMTVSCPAGQIITSVDFASYGTPTGACGGYTPSSCHSGTSLAQVRTACLDKNSCTVSATNGVFGDPCNGTVKLLDVQVTCMPTPDFLWLDATDASTLTVAGGVVSQWRDKSPRALQANQNPAGPNYTAAATPNGAPGLFFTPSTQRLVTGTTPTSAQMTVFVVFNMVNPQAWATLIEQNHDTYFAIRKSEGCCGAIDSLNFHIQNDNAAPVIPIALNSWRVLTAVRNATTSSISYLAGASASFTGDTLIGGQTAPLYIGASTGMESSGAYISEIRAYASALQSWEQAAIAARLQSKYGVP
jgi:hypothetical protein